MLLLKRGHGVKDAYAIPCSSATERKALLQRVMDETDATKVSVAWLEHALSIALADGLSADLPPPRALLKWRNCAGFRRCAMLYFLAPDSFLRKAWIHLNQRSDACGFIGYIMDGRVCMDGPTP